MAAALYLISAVIIGLLAIGQRGGFAVYFILAAGLSPILALLILILSSPRVVSYDDADYAEFCEWRARRRGR